VDVRDLADDAIARMSFDEWGTEMGRLRRQRPPGTAP
jgi:hypothetical protein